jgi:prepilin-type N-terminal cleavage/methylation domain-containing protein
MLLRLNQKSKHSAKDTKKGFSLIELLLVIAIIGILAAVAIPLFLGQRTKAAHTEAKTNLETIKLLEEKYFSENGFYGADGTYQYTESSITLQTLLPEFQPGDPKTLNFDYTLVISNTGTQFLATAQGKAGTIVEGATFSIDQDNNRSGF